MISAEWHRYGLQRVVLRGGPALNGSFRNVEVRRGDLVARNVDLYNYLLRGDKSGNIALEQGDIVFMPIIGPQVTMSAVRRAAIFELRGNESLTDVLRFAGGAEADAAIERVQIDRILPVGEPRPGQKRGLVDVSIADFARGTPTGGLRGRNMVHTTT